MQPDTTVRQEYRDALQQARQRRLTRESSSAYQQRLAQREELYVRGALRRREQVRRLRLTDGLPTELGGGRPVHPSACAAAVMAARAHLLELGLLGEEAEAELRRLWTAGAA